MRKRQRRRQLSLAHLTEGRIISRLEKVEPGIVRRILDEALAAGIEPSRKYLRKRLTEALEACSA